MITGNDIYDVLAAIVPLYVAMILAYGSVRWWKIFTPDQCSGINRFVAVFAVPLLSFHFISTNNIYAMNFHFIAADSLQKVIILIALLVWQSISKRGSLEWMITLFSLSTLPNTLVMGIPLLRAMYGDFSGSLMVQVVVLQSVIWYTLMLFLFEYRGARLLINEQFPDTAASITSFKVDSDVVSLNGRDPLQADAEIAPDGKLHVTLRRSSASSMISSFKSHGLNSITSITPRASNLTGVEIYSVQSSREPTPRASSFNQSDFYAMFAAGKAVGASPPKHHYTNSFGQGGFPDIYSLQSSKMATPRTSNFDEEMMRTGKRMGGRSMSVELYNAGSGVGFVPSYPPPNPMFSGSTSSNPSKEDSQKNGSKELHMFVWSSSTSPVSEGNFGRAVNKAVSTESDTADSKPVPGNLHQDNSISKGVQDGMDRTSPGKKTMTMGEGEDGKYVKDGEIEEGCKFPANGSPYTYRKKVEGEGYGGSGRERKQQMPPTSVMTRLILIMVWRKLIRNPNTYSSLLGLTWSLVSYRWKIEMPSIVKGSISILSDAGLGMAMFSLGLFMALQPKIIACGKTVATFSMAVRFLTGPAVMAATSIAIGLRGVLLHVAIVQAALPQGIVPFVFAKEYNVHPDILSTAVIFGMLIALPITILYYVLLGI